MSARMRSGIMVVVTPRADRPGWLELLVRDSTLEELAEHRRRLLEDADGSTTAQVEREQELAFELRARLVATRQHVDELTVLNDLARRLASLHDPEDVLQEVARQARRLLAVDLAYIMLLRDGAHLRIEVVDGSMGSRLRGIELAPGRGLGGRVLLTGQPLWSECYLEDDLFPHMPSADEAAVSEQLAGLLAVPLIVEDETIGVLLAADRHARAFVPHEVQLLASLAAHAAVAIRNATLFERSAKAAAELRAANDRLEATVALRQRTFDLREALTSEVLRGTGVAGVLARLTEAAGRPVRMFGEDDSASDGDTPLSALVDHVRGRDLFGDGSPVAELVGPAGPVLVARIALQSGYVGCLAVEGDGEWLLSALSIGATSVALVVASDRAVVEGELRARGELAHALLSPGSDERSVRRRARAAGLGIDAVEMVVVLDPGQRDDVDGALATVSRHGRRLADEMQGWSAEYDGHVVLLLGQASPERVSGRVRELLGPHGDAAAGVARAEGGVEGLRRAHEVARQTARVVHALGRNGDCLQATELGMYRSLFSQAGRDEVTAFVRATVGPLLDHDRSRQRDLAITLATYLQQAQHHSRTCALLHIHANTLYQRLERITALLGDDWREPDRVLELQLALHLQRLMGVSAG